MKHLFRIITGCIILALYAQAQAVSLEETFKKTIVIDQQTLLSLDNQNGQITVTAWDRDELEIIAYKKVRGRNEKQAKELMEKLIVSIRETNDEIQVETEFPDRDNEVDGFFSWLLNGGEFSYSVSYDIRVPEKFDLNLHSTNGQIYADRCEGRLRFETTNGKIEAKRIKGLVRCRTTNGSVSVSFDNIYPDEEMNFYSTNGSVAVDLPETINADLEAKTTNGSISCDLPLRHERNRSKNRLTGKINDGGAPIFIKTTNGSIRIGSIRIYEN